MKLEDAIKKVSNELMNMTQEEFDKELEKGNGDISRMVKRELDRWDKYVVGEV